MFIIYHRGRAIPIAPRRTAGTYLRPRIVLISTCTRTLLGVRGRGVWGPNMKKKHDQSLILGSATAEIETQLPVPVTCHRTETAVRNAHNAHNAHNAQNVLRRVWPESTREQPVL